MLGPIKNAYKKHNIPCRSAGKITEWLGSAFIASFKTLQAENSITIFARNFIIERSNYQNGDNNHQRDAGPVFVSAALDRDYYCQYTFPKNTELKKFDSQLVLRKPSSLIPYQNVKLFSRDIVFDPIKLKDGSVNQVSRTL